MLENDLILGTFVDTHLPVMTDPLLQLYEKLLQEADPDIFNWVSSKVTPPSEYNQLIQMLKDHSLRKKYA